MTRAKRKLVLALALVLVTVPTAGTVGAGGPATAGATVPVPPAPDGKIVFQRTGADGYSGEIWLMEADGSNPRALTSGHQDSNPQWSPQGRTIAFTRQVLGIGNRRVFTMAPDGTGLSAATLPPADADRFFEDLLAWTNDGSGVVFRRSSFRDDDITFSRHEVLTSGGARPNGQHFPFPAVPASDPEWVGLAPSNRCAEPDPGVVTLESVLTLPDPAEPRMMIGVYTQCLDTWVGIEPRVAVYGSSDVATRVPVAYPAGPLGRPRAAGEFSLADWSPDGTELYDGWLWAVPSTGGEARPLTPDRHADTSGFVPDQGCFVALDTYGGDGSWAPAGDMIAATMDGQVDFGLSESPPCTPDRVFTCASVGPSCTDDQASRIYGIWGVDPLGETVPRLLVRAGHSPDVQCRVGSCLTVLRVIAEGIPDSQYTFSGGISGTTTPVTPFGGGGVLSKKVAPGAKTVTALVPAGQYLDEVSCDADHTVSLGAGSVTLAVAEGEIVTCRFVFGGFSVDTDGDGLIDAVDECPEAPGPAETGGCPDSDGDGIVDADDDCPAEPGPAVTFGCPDPDTDGDGTVDRLDDCPDRPGWRSRHGCPEPDCEPVNEIDWCALEPGDVLLERGDNNVISGWGGSYWTHAAIFVGYFDRDGDGDVEPLIAQANPPNETCGTCVQDLEDSGFQDESLDDVAVVRLTGVSAAKRRQAAQWARSEGLKGLPYDGNPLDGDPEGTTDGWYCSEFVVGAFKSVGVNIAGRLPSPGLLLDERAMFAGFVTPEALYDDRSPARTVIARKKFASGTARVVGAADLMVTDELGRRSGSDGGGTYDEIPGAIALPDRVVSEVSAPGLGAEWTVTVTARQAGSWTLEVDYLGAEGVVVAGTASEAGATETVRIGDVVEHPPVAALRVAVLGSDTVGLDASASLAPDGTLVEYRFDVDGDGDHEIVGPDPYVEWTYTGPGTWTPAVTVVDDAGDSASKAGGTFATDDAGVIVPIPAISVAPTPRAGEPATLTVNGVGVDGFSWSWEIGGGTPVVTDGPSLVHTFDTVGAYRVVVRVDGGTPVALLTVTVREPFDPVAGDDVVAVPTGAARLFGVLDNDTVDDLDGSPSLEVLDGPSLGMVAVVGRHLRYIAGATSGADTLRYEVCDGGGRCDTADVAITVVDAVRPTATQDRYETLASFSVAAPDGLLANDTTGVEPVAIAVRSGTTPTDVDIAADGSFTFTMPDGFIGDVVFDYLLRSTDGTWSDPATVTIVVGAPGPPAAPSGLSGVAGNWEVALTWTAPAPASSGDPPITDYLLQRSTDGTTWDTLTDGVSASTSATATDLGNGTTYWFRVAAINAVGTGPASAEVIVALPPSAPAAPMLSATPQAAAVALVWSSSASGGSAITDYVLQQSKNGAAWKAVADGRNTKTAYLVKRLTNGTGYRFRIAAVSARGQGSWSPIVTAVPRTVPGTPRSVTVSARDRGVIISWAPPSSNGGSAITDFRIQMSLDGKVWTTIDDGVTTATTSTITGLTNGVKYRFRTAATNIAGTGTNTSTKSTTPRLTVPGVPRSLTAVAGDRQVRLTWLAPTSDGGSAITDFRIQMSLDGKVWTTIDDGVTTATTSTITGLTNGVKYRFRMAATNIAGTGTNTSTKTTTPKAPA